MSRHRYRRISHLRAEANTRRLRGLPSDYLSGIDASDIAVSYRSFQGLMRGDKSAPAKASFPSIAAE